MILVIDNYDSFTYNLVQAIGQQGADVVVRRNDMITVQDVVRLQPAGIVLSPGPGRPENAGACVAIVRSLAGSIPILGVCLGHQAIGAAFGGHVVHAPVLMHGKTSLIHHDRRAVYRDLPSSFEAGRYHSLVVADAALPDVLTVSATADDGTIMGIRHRFHPVEGIQFHPESVLTPVGPQLLRNWLAITGTFL